MKNNIFLSIHQKYSSTISRKRLITFNYLYIIIIFTTIYSHALYIVPLSIEHVQSVRQLILDCAIEFSIFPKNSIAEIKTIIHQEDECNNPLYCHPQGIFLIMLQDNNVIGTGGIKRLNATTVELKKMLLSKHVRNKGYGSQLLCTLIAYAKSIGYKKIRLEVWNPQTQQHAINFYKKFGFYKIPSHKRAENHYSMEKII